MIKKKFLSLVTIAIIALAGCKTTEDDSALIKKVDPAQLEQAKHDAEQFAEDILMGMKKVDYDLFVKNLKSRNTIKESLFPEMIKDFKTNKGVYVEGSRQYLGYINRDPMFQFLWKIKLKRTVKGKDGKMTQYTYDTLFIITTGDVDGKNYVVSFKFK